MVSLNGNREYPSMLVSVFTLADEIHEGLQKVQPQLSAGQLEQINCVLINTAVVRKSFGELAPLNNSSLRDACRELSARLDAHPSAAWTSFVVRILCLLNMEAGLDRGQLFTDVWQIVAQPAEEQHDGLGRVILRACIDSITAGETFASDDLGILMECIINTLRRSGNPSPLSRQTSRTFDGEAETGVLIPSQGGLRLVLDVASHALRRLEEESFRADNGSQAPRDDLTSRNEEAWRWDIHIEVIRLLHVCRLEEDRKHLVLTTARPLYHGWGHVGALEDIWSFIASADEESAELHLALLCVLAEDLMHFLALPARHSQAFWDLLYLAISNESDLCRRRGLHMLQRVLSWAEEGNAESSPESQAPSRPTIDARPTHQIFSGEALLQWKDLVRVLEVLEMETETHLLDQVVPTMERLCSKLSPPTSYSDAAPMATEFKWVAIPLGALISTGTVARRRKLACRIVTRDLGLGTCASVGAADGGVADSQALSYMGEMWVAQVLLPALDNVGWHSSTSRGSLLELSHSITEFLRCYLRGLPVPRVTTFLALLLESIRKRCIGSTGAICAILAAFDVGEAKVPAMGCHELFQLKEMLLVVLPPLNQAKRTLLLDGVVNILTAFTDYGQLVLSPSTTDGLFDQQDRSSASLDLLMSVLSAIPIDLVKHRYLPQLASWVADWPLQDGCTVGVKNAEECAVWLQVFRRLLEAYLRGRTGQVVGASGKGSGEKLIWSNAEGRKLCLLGLVLSQGFAALADRDQVLANGLSPLVKILRQCWHEPYVAAESVQAALVLFSVWAEFTDVDEGTLRWRWRPLEACVDEVATLVTARLGSSIEAAGDTPHFDTNTGAPVEGGDAQVLLAALSRAVECPASTGQSATGPSPLGTCAFHPGVVTLRDRCMSLLERCGEFPLPPATHLLVLACFEIIIQAQGQVRIFTAASAEKGLLTSDTLGSMSGCTPSANAERVVLSLLQNKVEGRIPCRNDSIGQAVLWQTNKNARRLPLLVRLCRCLDLLHAQQVAPMRPTTNDSASGSDSEWEEILKQHERRKWSCLSVLLPVVLAEADAASDGTGQGISIPVCDALVEGIRASLREEMPMAMACFRTVFPCYLQALSQGSRALGFASVFKLVWGAFKEVRRPQSPLIRDLIWGVLHPVPLAMLELNSVSATSEKAQESCVADAFNAILEFGASNKPNVLRALVGRLTTLWRQNPGNMLNLVPGIVDLLLFREWGQGIETISNDEANSVAEAPRLMLLLFIETWLIPSAASGNHDSRQMLRALTFHLMELQTSVKFRQSNITDPIVYGRKLRAWQALCVLCGYLCDTALPNADGHMSEIMDAIAAWFWPVHGRTALPQVRQLMEVFAVRMCKAYPDVFLAAAIKELSDLRLPGQVLCSLLVVAGHTLVGKEPIVCSQHRLSLFQACLPWMVGTHVMGRMISQFVCHSLLAECTTTAEGTHLEGLFLFLRDNPDMVKMRKRQLEAFSQTDCVAMCTVAGMLEAHGMGSHGEITPIHMCDLLQQAMDEIWNEALQDKIRTLEEGRAWLQTTTAVKKGTWFEEDAEEPRDADTHIQQKIIPWDKLDLAVEMANSASLEQSTAAGRMRQSVVVCATLVDKIPNLAGLARTCEIFAASSLVIPDARVIKNPAFSKISTGAEQWLPIEELGEKQLLAWIRRVKREGYALVGIEQTNNSVCLTQVKFPRRCVLVLGRENSGLPLAVINEMDFCCQIPQQGVLRSLNAHVSGALVLWEYTRQGIVSAPLEG